MSELIFHYYQQGTIGKENQSIWSTALYNRYLFNQPGMYERQRQPQQKLNSQRIGRRNTIWMNIARAYVGACLRKNFTVVALYSRIISQTSHQRKHRKIRWTVSLPVHHEYRNYRIYIFISNINTEDLYYCFKTDIFLKHHSL